MSLENNLISLINARASLDEGNLNEIKSLTSRISISNTRKVIHYTLHEKWVMELNLNNATLYDLELSGLSMDIDIPSHVNRLAFRLGKSFNNGKIMSRINSILDRCYRKISTKSGDFYIHESSRLPIKAISELILSVPYQEFDKMMINSVFGEIFYWRV